MKTKKLVLLGPITDFGGREIMTNMIFNTLKMYYETSIVSTVYMTKHSSALKNVDENSWTTLGKSIYKSNLWIAFTAQLTKRINKRREPAYCFVKNKLSQPFYSFNTLYKNTLLKQLATATHAVYSDEITGKWMPTVLTYCNTHNIKLVIRITGQIKTIPDVFKDSSLSCSILVHSVNNVKCLKQFRHLNVIHIDQSTAREIELVAIPIQEEKQIVYGFLGRFNPEKGISTLVETFSKNNKSIRIAGSGPLIHQVKALEQANVNSKYVGEVKHNELPSFFKQIDVLIIASHEEGGPIVGVEAMAAGKLIITTPVGAMPERLNKTDNTFLFQHDNPNQSLSSCISGVEHLTKNERLAIRQQLREKFLTSNALEVISQQYLECIKSM